MSALKTPVGDHDHIQGDAQAPITLVEYGDYECPHCAAAHPLIRQLEAHFGAKLRFVFRNFPLNRIHPMAESAAQSAEFAASKGKFWPMHDLLLENQSRLSRSVLAELAAELGLDPVELETALENSTFERRVHVDFTGGVRSGVNGTPTFFLNGERYDGPKDYDNMAAAIEALLADAQ
jgi:protein-disulfide isomerase